MKIINEIYPTTRNLDEGLKNNNLTTMAKKLCEEATEVMEAATKHEIGGTKETGEELVQELLDTMQMSLNIINYIKQDIVLDIKQEVKKHNKKLQERGWEWDTSFKMEFEKVQHESRR